MLVNTWSNIVLKTHDKQSSHNMVQHRQKHAQQSSKTMVKHMKNNMVVHHQETESTIVKHIVKIVKHMFKHRQKHDQTSQKHCQLSHFGETTRRAPGEPPRENNIDQLLSTNRKSRQAWLGK
jgi:hypothetical protein